MAEDTFPDNTGLEWIIHRSQHADDFTLVEVEPKPAEVGYPRFKFFVSFLHPQKPEHWGTYIPVKSHWELLCYDPKYKAKPPGRLP